MCVCMYLLLLFHLFRCTRFLCCRSDDECLNFGLVHDFRILIAYNDRSQPTSFQINDNKGQNLRLNKCFEKFFVVVFFLSVLNAFAFSLRNHAKELMAHYALERLSDTEFYVACAKVFLFVFQK